MVPLHQYLRSVGICYFSKHAPRVYQLPVHVLSVLYENVSARLYWLLGKKSLYCAVTAVYKYPAWRHCNCLYRYLGRPNGIVAPPSRSSISGCNIVAWWYVLHCTASRPYNSGCNTRVHVQYQWVYHHGCTTSVPVHYHGVYHQCTCTYTTRGCTSRGCTNSRHVTPAYM